MKNVRRVFLKRMRNSHAGSSSRKSSSTSIPPDSVASTSSSVTGPPPVTPTTPTASPLRRGADSVTNSPTPPVVAAQPHEAWTKPVSSAPATSLSGSIPKLSIGLVDEAGPLDRQEMIGITKDVQKFLATISELRLAMEEGDSQPQRVPRILRDDDDDDSGSEEESNEERGPNDEGRGPGDSDVVIEKLRALIHVVEQCLQSNTGMQSTELTRASQSLLVTYDGCTHNGGKVSACPTCDRAINQLCDVFTHSVSEYMNGDNLESAMMLGVGGAGGGVNTTPSHHARRSQQPNLVYNRGLGMSKSYEQLPRYGSFIDLTQQPVPNEPIIDRIDQALMAMENNVEVTASYIKCRQKYHREVLSCLAKRAQLEQRYYHQLNKLVRTTQQSLSELRQQQESLPLVDVFMSALEQDSRYAMNCNTTFNLQVGHKIIEGLNRKVHEGDKMRKTLIQNWQRERRKVMDARNTLKAAKTKYRDLGQELVRVKNLLAADPFGKQADKMKKQVTDLELRWQESEAAYKLAVANCNDCQYQVHATAQKSILCAYRRMVIDFDASLKAGLEHFYQLQVNFFTSLPEPLQRNVEEVQQYEVGKEFLGFINRQPHASVELEDYHFEEMDPEAEAFEEGGDDTAVAGLESPSISQQSSSNDIKSLTERATSPVIAAPFLGLWDAVTKSHNDTASPRADKKRPKSIAVLEDAISTPSPVPESPLHRTNSEKSKAAIIPAMSPAPGEDALLSRVARTHNFKRLRTPARCRGCDTYVYFHGFECETCGLACHRKCLSTLAIRCGNRRLPRKMNTFGVGFHAHLKATKRMVPIIVTKCINEMDERGLSTQGLYRISSAKSKMEKLCQLFEAGSERVDLSDLQPHLISSCLKLYFRQLPEPLLTFDLYHDFIGFAREASNFLPCNFAKASPERELQARDLLEQLRSLINSLSEATQLTLARLMYHLHRVSSPEHVKFNCMPASNLGIVFGPNLLRQEEVISSLAVLANMSYQAKAVEIMVAHAHDIFVVPEKDIKQLEMESDDSDTYTAERLVDATPPTSSPPRVELEPDTSPDPSLSNTMEVEDMRGTFSEPRTPYNTPPERRKHNVEELHKALEVFGSTSKPKNNVVPPIQASPLLKDSRHWTDSPLETLLPGTVDDDDHSFTEEIMKTLDQRPSFKEVLTPVLEFTPDEDYKANNELSDGEEEDVVIVTATTQHNLENGRRRRTHSLTKSTSDSDHESAAGQDEDGDVFRHTPPDPTPIHQNSMFTSRSEDNLLQCRTSFSPEEEDEDEIRKRNNFEAVIQKYMVESSGRKSAGSSSSDLQEVAMAEYKPYLPDLQTILSTSLPSSPRSSIFSNPPSNKRGTPAHSLPRNFSQTTKSHRLPTRQYSEGHIHSPMFQIASPPLTSPVSLTSGGKASSQGSFSEGFSEELNEEIGLRRKRESDLVEQRSVEEREETDGLTDSGVAQPEGMKAQHETSDSGVDNTRHHSTDEEHHDDLPLPDNSPARHSLHISYLHSESRDSGLSDSPVPFADYSQIKGCKSSPQRHSAASGLAQTSMHAPSDKMTSADPLATAGSSSSDMPTQTDEYHDRHTSPSLDSTLPQSPDHTSEPRSAISPGPPKPNHLPLLESDSKLDAVEHIRMVSSEELAPTPRRRTVEKFGMKRSQSHGEALSRDSNSSPTFSHQTRHGRLIILADNSKQTDQSSDDCKTAAAGASKDSSKGKGKRRRKFKSSECLYQASSSPRSHRRTPFFV